MNIGLIDIGGKLPNLALMKVSAYHKSLGDTVTMGTGGDLTYISCIFSKHRHVAERLLDMYPAAVAGGPGWDHTLNLPPEIASCQPDYALYGINYGLGRLTAGCPGNCPWCVVPAMEGSESKTVAEAGNIANGDFLVLLDANILACSDWRIENEEHVKAGIAALNKAGIKPYRLRFYVMVGYNTTWEQDYHRFAVLRDLGAEPFIMCYEGSSPKLRAFARWVNRFIYKKYSWEENDRWGDVKEAQQTLNFQEGAV